VASAATAQEPLRGGTLSVALSSEPVHLNGALTPASGVGMVSTKMLEGLLGYDFELNPVPRLATGWIVAPDGLSITLRLRAGVKWHDGTDFTAADVAFSLLQVWKVLHPRGRATFAGVTAVETPDPLTALLRLSVPAPALLAALSGYESPVLPKHLYEGSDIANNPRNSAPIGTGPFRFKEWRRGEAIRLERDPGYREPYKPYLDAIDFRILPGGGNRVAAFETGEVMLGAFNPVPLNDVERLDKLAHLDIETRGYEYFAPMYVAQFNLRNRVLADPRVRQAFAHAIDRAALMRSVWFGFAGNATGPVPSAQKRWYTDDVPRQAFDPKRAEQLLDEAGQTRGPEGRRFRLTLDYLPVGADHRRTAEFLRQQLARVGIELTVREQELPAYMRRIYTDQDFDLAVGPINAMADPGIGVLRLYGSKSIESGLLFGNAGGYRSAAMDRAIDAAQIEGDTALRRGLLGQVQRLAQQDLPLIDLFEPRFFTVFNKRLHGHTIGAEGVCGSFAEAWLAR